jgi:pyruvate,water dikinase
MYAKVKSFSELKQDEWARAGGKGGTLARLYQDGYPVPNGFVIFPDAFVGEQISDEGWDQVLNYLARTRNRSRETSFAVRSSALSEDSAQASFAGEFETVLEVRSDDMIFEAIRTVHHSRTSERVKAYSQAQGMDEGHDIAVVVQQQVRAELSGILFTADPVTGSHMQMAGNYIFGLGDQLVSGEVEPYTFTFSRPKGIYEGPAELERVARELFKLALRLEKELGCPQDIEWCVAENKLYLLQSRPITTLTGYDPRTAFWNASHIGDYVWFRHEVFPDVLTPASWSIWQNFQQFTVADVPGMGNIGGRMYMNYSFAKGVLIAFGSSEEDILDQVLLTAGAIPPAITVPDIPLTRWGFIKAMLPIMWEFLPKQLRLRRQFRQIVDAGPVWCTDRRQEIKQTSDKAALITMWQNEILPYFNDLMQLQDKVNEDYFNPYKALKKDLVKLVGQEKAMDILALLSGGTGQLASMGSLVGLARLARGEIGRQEYMQMAGHRPTRENELAEPRPYEDPAWLDRQLAEFYESPVDVEAMAGKRAAEFERAWQKLAKDYPPQAKRMCKKLEQINRAMGEREELRSELTRSLGVIRDWFLRAAELSGLEEADLRSDNIFYLTNEEVVDVLSGKREVLEHIPARCELYAQLEALPAYPSFISGRFDPFHWAADPERRGDVFDSHAPLQVVEMEAIEGYPGSSGRVEGVVRHLSSPEEGALLQDGEILLASTTNVGWTPIFPRAAAVITDIGAPLSHAAIVARELGIPAVVGTGDATMRLRSGDRVMVDGGRGVVQLLKDEPKAKVHNGI